MIEELRSGRSKRNACHQLPGLNHESEWLMIGDFRPGRLLAAGFLAAANYLPTLRLVGVMWCSLMVW